MKSQCHLTIPSWNTRMMIGKGGKYKNGVQKLCKVEVDVIPISKEHGSMWKIMGEKENIRCALQYLNSIHSNTILKMPENETLIVMYSI